jgi:uncharacterized protein YuzE
MTDHYLLMTATPHKGDPDNFRLFLELLDKDVYGDITSLEDAMREHEAPFYLCRIKEALVTFPDPDTGDVHQLFTRRNVQTAPFHLNLEEMDFYDELTRYVEDQSIKASEDGSARGRALGFTMAMLQRRFASSVYAVRRSLERMKATREKILADPDAYRQEQILKRIPEDFEDLPDDEQQDIMLRLEEVVPSRSWRQRARSAWMGIERGLCAHRSCAKAVRQTQDSSRMDRARAGSSRAHRERRGRRDPCASALSGPRALLSGLEHHLQRVGRSGGHRDRLLRRRGQRSMKLEFDPAADAAYFEISPAEVETTKEIEPWIIADYDADGHLVGIEILSVSKRARPQSLEQVA